MTKSKEFIVAGIRNLLKRNYNIASDTIDVWSLVDSTLTFQENWAIVKEFVLHNRERFSPPRCKNCNHITRGVWNYCPECGKQIEEVIDEKFIFNGTKDTNT